MTKRNHREKRRCPVLVEKSASGLWSHEPKNDLVELIEDSMQIYFYPGFMREYGMSFESLWNHENLPFEIQLGNTKIVVSSKDIAMVWFSTSSRLCRR